MTASHRTGHTMTVGTVHYMAPEISEGRYDASVDIYALGVMLYEMLTGTPPFVGQSLGEVLMKQMSAEPDLSMIEAPFRQVIAKALAKNPSDRYPSPVEMVEAVFGQEHVQNSVVEFNPQELTMVANMAARKAVTPSGRPASSRPGGASWGKTWTPDNSDFSDHESKTPDAAPRSDVWVAEPAATPTSPKRNRRSGATVVAPAPAHPGLVRDPMPAFLRLGLAAAVLLVTTILVGRLSPGPQADRFMESGTTLRFMVFTTLVAALVCRLTPSPASRPVGSRIRAVGCVLLGALAVLMTHHIFFGPAVILIPAAFAFPFAIHNWPLLCSEQRSSRLSPMAIATVAFGTFLLTGIFLRGYEVYPTLLAMMAAAIGIALQITSPFATQAVSELPSRARRSSRAYGIAQAARGWFREAQAPVKRTKDSADGTAISDRPLCRRNGSVCAERDFAAASRRLYRYRRGQHSVNRRHWPGDWLDGDDDRQRRTRQAADNVHGRDWRYVPDSRHLSGCDTTSSPCW